MKYIVALAWSFFLVNLLNYVVGAIANVPFDFQAGAIISVILAVLIVALGESMPEEPVSDH